MTYAVVAWLLLQIIVEVEEPLHLPEWTDTLVIVLLGIGFVVAVLLAWAYELTPGGIERERPLPTDGTVARAHRSVGYAVTAILAGLLGATAYSFLARDSDEEWLQHVALPEIEGHLAVGNWQAAYTVMRQAAARVPDDPDLAELWPRLSWRTTIQSDPPGAAVFRQSYDGSGGEWENLGRTPLEDIHFPYGLSRLRFELDGFRTLHRTVGGGHVNPGELRELRSTNMLVGIETFKLDTEETLPDDKVRVSGWDLVIDGESLPLNDFFMDRYEVTNASFRDFIDAGGYQRSNLWDPIIVDDEVVPLEQAMELFTDRTGQPGPSTWEAGDYPEGEGDFPVSGVSWYEAAAFARFAGQELPTAHHWRRSLALATLQWLLPESNFDGTGPRSVLDSRAMSYTGAFDLAGNVREWTSTRIGDQVVILGGSWNDPYYVVGAENTTAPPLDRSAGNGFRLIVTDDEPQVASRVRAALPARSEVSTLITRQPVADAVYRAYGRVFDYEQGPLNAAVDEPVETRSWIRERITFDAGYGAERMVLYLYVPTVGSAPFRTVVYWPGWDTFRLDSVDEYFAKQADFLLKSGRAVAFPVYKGSFERGDGTPRPRFNTTAYRDNTIAGIKDLRRTLDYLETRNDIDHRSIAFYGYSWGGVNGPTALAQEPRLRSAVIYVGLLPELSETPEIDPVNALPRVDVPLLMLSGEFDVMVPVENARRYFELVGTADARKKHVITPAGHFVPRNLLIRETLDWLDQHQGRPGG